MAMNITSANPIHIHLFFIFYSSYKKVLQISSDSLL